MTVRRIKVSKEDKPKTEKKATARGETITVSRTVGGQSKEEQKTIDIRPFLTDTATVRVDLGRTISTRPYESAKITVSISMPCYVEEVGDVYRVTLSNVKKLLAREVDEIIQSAGEQEEDINDVI